MWGLTGILFITMAITSLFWGRQLHRQQKLISQLSTEVDELRSLKESSDLEERLRGKLLPFNELKSLTEESSQKGLFRSNLYTLVLVVSLSNCSSCRDEEIQLWQEFYNSRTSTKCEIVAVFSESVMTEQERTIVKKYVQSFDLTMLCFLDQNNKILEFLHLKPEQTPVALLINRFGRIILVHQALAQNPEKTVRFQELVYRLFEGLQQPETEESCSPRVHL